MKTTPRHTSTPETKGTPRGIQFMILALPRSGTAWLSNWMTTPTTRCIHDPLFKYPNLSQLESLRSEKLLGISDTGIYLKYNSWVRNHPARKVGLIRPRAEVNASLDRMGFRPLTVTDYHRTLAALRDLPGIVMVDWASAMGSASVWDHLLPGVPYDDERTQDLLRLNVQRADFTGIRITEDAV